MHWPEKKIFRAVAVRDCLSPPFTFIISKIPPNFLGALYFFQFFFLMTNLLSVYSLKATAGTRSFRPLFPPLQNSVDTEDSNLPSIVSYPGFFNLEAFASLFFEKKSFSCSFGAGTSPNCAAKIQLFSNNRLPPLPPLRRKPQTRHAVHLRHRHRRQTL